MPKERRFQYYCFELTPLGEQVEQEVIAIRTVTYPTPNEERVDWSYFNATANIAMVRIGESEYTDMNTRKRRFATDDAKEPERESTAAYEGRGGKVS